MKRRQIHLDFHTSEKIDGIGEKFNKKQFQDALKLGHVNSITVFSKCHHGWAYHPSKANEIHPNLNFDLLGEQIAACKEIGVKAPVYISAGLDEKMARRHPEWLIRNKDEKTTWVSDFTQPGYHRFCFNSPYLDYLLAQIKEVCENYNTGRIFLDIVGVIPCYCQNCVKTLMDEGKDPYNKKNIDELAERVYANYCKKVREVCDSVDPSIMVFHNGGHIRAGRRDLAHFNSHLELESLPTGGWGYDHFPMSAAYARTLGMDFLGMTGKFHQSWGEFGGFKHPNALKYEVALSSANSAKVSIGDQLHPNGEMDEATYALVGEAFAMLEEREKWLDGAKNYADIAVVSNEAIYNYLVANGYDMPEPPRADTYTAGAIRILLEGKYLFDVVDLAEDFTKYKLVILPDNIKLDENLAEIFAKFIKDGGKILASGRSGLSVDESKFLLDFGAEYLGANAFNPTYVCPNFELKSLRNSAFILYKSAFSTKTTTGKELAVLQKPYFNRTVAHFCSHRHTPSSTERDCAAIYENKNTVYLGFNAFEEYGAIGTIFVKEIVTHLIESLIGEDKKIACNLPAQGIVTVTSCNGSDNVHLIYASPVRRGNNIEIIEDILPIYGSEITVKTDKKPAAVRLVPENKKLDYSYKDGKVSFTVDRFECWQIVEISY